MNKMIFKVFKFEVIRQLKKPSFWIAALLMPVLMGFAFLISYFSGAENVNMNGNIDENTKIAITDKAGIMPAENPFNIYETKEDGVAAIKNGDIDLYFYIPEDFSETNKIDFYHISEGLDIFNFDGNAIKAILSQYASAKMDPLDSIAVTGNYEVIDNKLTTSGEASNALGKAIIPIVVVVVFFIFMVMFGSRLLMVVVEEKENRISEMILTSISAKHLIVGKIIAMITLGIIQILVISIPALILTFINRNNPMVTEILSIIEIDPVVVLTSLLLLIFSILLFAGLCTMIGVLMPTAKDASSYIGPVVVGAVFPLYFMQAFLASTPNALVYFLTYFPLSSPIAMMLRSAVGTLGPIEYCIGLIEIIILSIIVIGWSVKLFQKNAINFEIVKPKFLKH